ncbi:DUF1150 family protein [Aliiroseovarius sp. KMU-50]|uniref:DUF1150 family protein n=1 Tax=Aliiroseovarius salicola TaxID=3009082 RepID=A0ABT4VZF4_9RHOB|nr:DUF1150 family protein [Aliiroseovarius sp. KMU-50]MDA5093646.1 DUF1150 family protein [Aliiroseovarius sp. KMU-50]
MDIKFDVLPEAENRIVYVRKVNPEDLPAEIREQTEGMERLYAVHNVDGEQLAIVQGRRTAFALARQHDLTPVNVH